MIACGSEDESKFKDPDAGGAGFGDGSAFGDSGGQQEDLYKDDPLPNWCGPDGGAAPTVTGTKDCPSDKNKPGCACTNVGEKAACWTGLRKHRNLGICEDGTTTCIASSETGATWGPCQGQVLPKPGATGSDGCGCFSAGLWKIANTVPCIRESAGSYWAYSATYNAADPTKVLKCSDADHMPAGQAPPGIWSPNKLTVDCAGEFRLCYRIKAGKFSAPSGGDCTLGEVCIDANYTKENVEQALTDLPPWAGTNQECAKKWETTDPNVSPGYGEMVVKGKTILCEAIDDGKGQDFVFQRVEYCPHKCRTNPSDPACSACGPNAQGGF